MTPNPSVPVHVAPGWSCPSCTFRNSDTSKFICDVCGQEDHARKAAAEAEKKRKAEEEERKRKKQAEELKKQLVKDRLSRYEMLQHIAGTLRTLKTDVMVPQNDQSHSIITELYHQAKRNLTQSHKEPKAKPLPTAAECAVCYDDFDCADGVARKALTKCNHRNICTGCFERYVTLKIKEKDTLPWLICPEADCTLWILPQDVLNTNIPPRQLYLWAFHHIGKQFLRDPDWVPCVAKCGFGFMVPEGQPPSTRQCGVCHKSQKVKHRKLSVDKEMKKMLADGVMRVGRCCCVFCGRPTARLTDEWVWMSSGLVALPQVQAPRVQGKGDLQCDSVREV